MIPSIDYLTLVLAGAVLWYVGVDSLGDNPGTWMDRFGLLLACIGTILFVVGAARAFMGAVGL